jgi:integrase
MPLTIKRRRDTGALVITGTVAGRRIRESAGTDNLKLAREVAALREAELLRGALLGTRATRVSFAQAAEAYLRAEPRRQRTKDMLARLLPHLRDETATSINQVTVDQLREKLLAPDAKPATVVRSIIGPLSAVLHFAAARQWCDRPSFTAPRQDKGRTVWLRPAEYLALEAAAAGHLRPLLRFLVSTGARLSEALELDWRQVDLAHARVEFIRTKNGKARLATLPPAALLALANMPAPADGPREGRVFLRPTHSGHWASYADSDRYQGGQIRTAWAGACKRAGLAGFTPHDVRHTWATWRYAVDRDPLALRDAGGWSSLTQVERYAHLAPPGLAQDMLAVWGVERSTEERKAG